MKKFTEFLEFMVKKLTCQLGATTKLYQSANVSSTVGQQIVGNAKPVQGVNQVCIVKSQNINYFQDAATILPPGTASGNINAVALPSTDVTNSIDQVIPIAAGTMVLTAWVEVIVPAVATTCCYHLGVNTTSAPTNVGSTSVWGTALDMCATVVSGLGLSGAGSAVSGLSGTSGYSGTSGTSLVILAGADSPFVPVFSPIMFPVDGTIDLTASNIVSMTSNATVIVYAMVLDLNF